MISSMSSSYDNGDSLREEHNSKTMLQISKQMLIKTNQYNTAYDAYLPVKRIYCA